MTATYLISYQLFWDTIVTFLVESTRLPLTFLKKSCQGGLDWFASHSFGRLSWLAWAMEEVFSPSTAYYGMGDTIPQVFTFYSKGIFKTRTCCCATTWTDAFKKQQWHVIPWQQKLFSTIRFHLSPHTSRPILWQRSRQSSSKKTTLILCLLANYKQTNS